MNNSPLDEHIKKQFGNYKPDVPAHIWDNIVAEREKRKPVGFWFSLLNKTTLLILSGVLLLGTATILYKNFSSTKNNDTPNSIKAVDTKQTVQTTINSQENNLAKDKNIAAPKTSQNNPGNIGNTIETGKNPGEQKINNTITNNSKTKTGNSIVESKKKNRADNITGIDNNNDKKETNAVVVNSRRSKHTKARSRFTYQPALAVADENTEVEETSTYITTSNDLLLDRMLLNLDLLRAVNNIPSTVKKPGISNINVPCPESEKNAAGNKRYFEIYGGPDYAFRKLTDTGNSAYLQKRKESTHFTSAFSVGARYTKVFSNGMSFRTGINYSQINEKFKFAEGNIIQVIYIINANGDTTGSYASSGTRYKTTHNKFKTIDVPLLLGYELGNGRIHVNLNAGAMINVYSWQKGDVLDTAYKPISITTGKSSSPYQFKTNVGIGFIGSASVYYKLTDRLHILAEPYFRYNFSPASKADLTIKQKYNTAGIRLGVRIDF